MTDLDLLREAWETPEPPSRQAYLQARSALNSRLNRRRRWFPRPGSRVAMAGVLGLVLAAGVTVVQVGFRQDSLIPGLQSAPVANAAEVLDRAASAAESRPFVAPRPDQWVYYEERTTTSAFQTGISVGPPYVTETIQHWQRADGKQWATAADGGPLRYLDRTPDFPLSDYASLADMPATPTALRNWIYKNDGSAARGSAADRAASGFGDLDAILRYNVLPPRTEAAVFRTLKTLPGVTLAKNAVDVAGRPAFALGILEDGWIHNDLLLDRENYAYLGERSITIKDRTIPADDRGDGKVRLIKKGTIQLFLARLVSGVVYAPGQLP